MGVLRSDRVSGLGGANAINGSVNFPNDGATGTGDYLRVDKKDNSDYNLSTNDFTIEFWFNSRNVGSTLHPLTFAASTVSASSDVAFYLRFNGGVINAYCFEGNNTIGGVSTGSVNAYTWYHVAYVRSGSTFTIYLDGTSAATASSAEAVNYNAGWNLNIGSAYTNTYHYNGYLSNVRIVNGTALYTSNFTVPNRLEAVDNTVLLCCQSPGNVLQEASGKTLQLIRTSNNSGPAHASRFVPDVGEDHGTTFTDNTKFDTLSYMVPPGGTTIQSNRGRGILFGGYSTSPNGHVDTIQYIEIQSMGNSVDFGSLTAIRSQIGAVSSSTRAVSCGGGSDTPADYSNVNTCEFVTIATTSNTTDFGDLTASRTPYLATSNDTRGIIFGGYDHPTNVNIIDYITIASAGNATDFGDEINSNRGGGCCSSPTRGFTAGGFPYTNAIDYVTISTTGNSQEFGDLLNLIYGEGGVSNSTRAVFAGGAAPSPTGAVNVIQYITMASSGNATDFGDLNTTEKTGCTGNSNSIRGIFSGGYDGATFVNSVSYITIASTGSGQDFGDISGKLRFAASTSDSHGGLS